jgi:hypothetical protein
MVTRPPEHHYEPCTICHDAFPSSQMQAVSEVIPGRKRGWICDGCKDRRGGIIPAFN